MCVKIGYAICVKIGYVMWAKIGYTNMSKSGTRKCQKVEHENVKNWNAKKRTAGSQKMNRRHLKNQTDEFQFQLKNKEK